MLEVVLGIMYILRFVLDWSMEVINKEVYIFHLRKALGVTDVLVDELKRYVYNYILGK